MTKLVTIVLSSVLSIVAITLLGPRLGLFQWAERGTSEEAAPAPEGPAKVSPAKVSLYQSEKPDWVDESLAALRSDVVRIEREIAAVRDDIDRYREALPKARADHENQRRRQQEQRSREERRASQDLARQRARRRSGSGQDSQAGTSGKLTVSGCRREFGFSGRTTFRFTVSNSGSEYASAQAAVYMIVTDLLLGPKRFLIERMPVEVAPRSSEKFSPTWTLIQQDIGVSRCEVEIEQ